MIDNDPKTYSTVDRHGLRWRWYAGLLPDLFHGRFEFGTSRTPWTARKSAVQAQQRLLSTL